MLEVDIAGPGYEARGVTTAPFPGYVFIGRREDFAFTLTSAGADIVDHYVETLCGSDTKYVYTRRVPGHGALRRGQAHRHRRRDPARWSSTAPCTGR